MQISLFRLTFVIFSLRPLLFLVVMQEATKEARREGLKELLYVDDLVLMAESEEEVSVVLCCG